MATVRPGLGVATETGDEGQVEVEDVLQPLNSGGGLVGENLDQLGASLVSGGLEGIIVELLDAVLNLQVNLGAREGAVDTGGSLGGVATEEGCTKFSLWSPFPLLECGVYYLAYRGREHFHRSGRRCGRH